MAKTKRERPQRAATPCASVVTDKNPPATDSNRTAHDKTPQPRPRGLLLQSVADVKAERVTWLWSQRIPCGKLTLLVGDPEAGKTFVTLDFAARVSRGTAWPDGDTAPLGNVILCAIEDGLADTIRPRLDALTADVSRIFVVDSERRPFTLADDLKALEASVIDKQVRLVVVDPLNAYLGGQINAWKDDNVRVALTPLTQMAERTGVAVVGIMHLSKNEERGLLQRVMGSVGFVAVARVVMHARNTEQGNGWRTLSVVKNNLAPRAHDLRYRIMEGALEWAPPEQVAGAVSAPRVPQTAIEQAEHVLRRELANGEKPVETVRNVAIAEGVSLAALRRARERLNVATVKSSFETKGWLWRLAPSTPATMDEMGKMDGAHPAQLAHLDPPGTELSQRGTSALSTPPPARSASKTESPMPTRPTSRLIVVRNIDDVEPGAAA